MSAAASDESKVAAVSPGVGGCLLPLFADGATAGMGEFCVFRKEIVA